MKKILKTSVSFDGLRSNATNAYNKISRLLNELEIEEWQKQEFEEPMQDLRFALGVFNACSMKEVKYFNDMSEKLSFVDFNPVNEDD